MTEQARLYGVSFGDGNNGVSHIYPAYYVRTAAPYDLALAALLSEFKSGHGQAWAKRHAEVDGESDYTIRATLSCPPCEDSNDGEYPELPEDVEYEDAEDGRNWDMHNGAWMICEVFPEDEPREGVQVYDSLEDALTEDVVTLARAK